MPHSLLHNLSRGSQRLSNFVVFICLQVTRYAAAYGIKYVALSNYKGTIFGMCHAPHQLLLSNLIRFNDMAPSILEVKNFCGGNAKQTAASATMSHCTSVILCHDSPESMACGYAVYTCHHNVGKLRGHASALETLQGACSI